MTTYRIKDWDEKFETHQGRKRLKGALPWVRVPTADGLTYRRLMREANGPAVYGCFIAMVRVAARLTPRGILFKDGRGMTAADLEDLTDIPQALMAEAIETLSSERIGWLLTDASQAVQRADSVIERADFCEQRAEKAIERAGSAQKSRNLRDRGEEKRGEEKRGEAARSITPQPDETDAADPSTDRVILTDRELVRPLAPYVRWQTNDPDRSADNLAELVGLIQDHGAQAILTAARNGCITGDGKLWPNEIAEHLPGATPKPAEPSPIISPETAQALAILDRLGYQAAHDLMGYPPGKVPNDAALRSLVTKNIGTAIELIRVGGGK